MVILLISRVVFIADAVNSSKVPELHKKPYIVVLSRFAETLTNDKAGDNYA